MRQLLTTRVGNHFAASQITETQSEKSPQEGADGEKKSPKKKDTKPAIETVYVPIEEGNIGRLGKAGANVKTYRKGNRARISVTTDTPDKPQVLIKGRSDQVNAAKTQIELSISRSDSGKGQKQLRERIRGHGSSRFKNAAKSLVALIGQKGSDNPQHGECFQCHVCCESDTNNVKISSTSNCRCQRC